MRIVVVIPNSHIDAANAAYKALGWGEWAALHRLSANGQEPVTHWGGLSSISDDVAALLQAQLDESSPQYNPDFADLVANIKHALIESQDDGFDYTTAAVAFFAEQGLTSVVDSE